MDDSLDSAFQLLRFSRDVEVMLDGLLRPVREKVNKAYASLFEKILYEAYQYEDTAFEGGALFEALLRGYSIYVTYQNVKLLIRRPADETLFEIISIEFLH